MHNNPPAPRDWLLMIVLAFIWGLSFIFIKHSVSVFSPPQMAMWRIALSFLIYLPVALTFYKEIKWEKWPYLLIVVFCGSAIPNLLFATAQQHVESGLAGILNSLTPLFTLLIGAYLFGTGLNLQKILGVLLGLGGAMLLVLNGSAADKTQGNIYYSSLCVLATVCYAINANVVGKFFRTENPAVFSSAAFMLAGPFFLVGVFQTGGFEVAVQHTNGLKAMGSMVYLAGVGTVFASILYFRLLQRTSPLFAASVTYLSPVVSMIVGLYFGEAIGWIEVVGAAIILTGLYLAGKKQ